MKFLFRKQAIVLASLLQVLPIMRTLVVNPATTSTFAIIMRWTIGSTAVLGAYDAYSASSQTYFAPLETNMVLTVGAYYTNSIVVTNTGSDKGAYFELTTSGGLDSGQIGGGGKTTVCLPDGITLECFDIVTSSKRWYYAAIYGTPTSPTPAYKVTVDAGFSGAGDIYTNVFFTVVGGVAPPYITNSPSGTNVVAGGTASFQVGVSNAASVTYQWRFNSTDLANATNNPLTLDNVRTNQAGGYRVVVSNPSGGMATSEVAQLTVSIPPPPELAAQPPTADQFVFSFVPVVGLTNTVLTNGLVSGGIWRPLTNIPPPSTAEVISITNPITGPTMYFRAKFDP